MSPRARTYVNCLLFGKGCGFMGSASDIFLDIINKSEIYFKNELISKEHLIRLYAEFIIKTFDLEKHNVDIVLHTGSICFDVITILISAISNMIFNESTCDDVIASLKVGDIVLFGKTKKQRYIFSGLEKKEHNGSTLEYVILNKSDTERITVHPQKRQYIEPYNGNSNRMDGRGIRKKDYKRIEFISEVIGMDVYQFPSVIDTSSVVVMPREVADQIINGVTIRFNGEKQISLLDIMTVSYFTENEEYPYGGNPGKIEPVLKITNRISVARDLIMSQNGNKITGLLILGNEIINRGRTELPELMNRSSLKYVIVSFHIDSEGGESIIKEYEKPNVFACTKKFLLRNNFPILCKTPLITELAKQINNTISREVKPCIIRSEKTWNEYREIKKALFVVKNAEIIEEYKDYFLIHAYSLLKLFTTAIFPINSMEGLIRSGALDIDSPQAQLDKLLETIERFPVVYKEKAKFVIDQLEHLYLKFIDENPKQKALINHLKDNSEKTIAIIVPKAYYANIIYAEKLHDYMNKPGKLMIFTANKFDNSILYDEIIATGDFKGKRFDVFKCRASAMITTLLYDFESNIFRYKMKLSIKLENFIDEKSRVSIKEAETFEDLFYDNNNGNVTDESIEELDTYENDLINYINKVRELSAINAFGRTAGNGNVVTAEVVMIGTFASEEKIFFTKSYKAYVFDSARESVEEVTVENLAPGDTLVFTKNDSVTKDIVDGILEQLIQTDTIDHNIKIAFRKSKYWKEVLRGFMISNEYSYRKLAFIMSEYGSTKTETAIRNWLDEDAHIVGPRDEETFHQIAKMTNDKEMLKDPSEYCASCSAIRKIRRQILKLIGISIINKLSGRLPDSDLLLEAVSNHIDDLAIMLQLESILEVNRVQVPINMINHPISL